MLRKFLILTLAMLGLASSQPASAISLQEAARNVAKQYNAKVLSARTVLRKGRKIHEIKVVTADGVVKTVTVPQDA